MQWRLAQRHPSKRQDFSTFPFFDRPSSFPCRVMRWDRAAFSISEGVADTASSQPSHAQRTGNMEGASGAAAGAKGSAGDGGKNHTCVHSPVEEETFVAGAVQYKHAVDGSAKIVYRYGVRLVSSTPDHKLDAGARAWEAPGREHSVHRQRDRLAELDT
jgi:hypothetical protein